MKVKLIVIRGNPEGAEIEFSSDRFLIGRAKDCDLRPQSKLVSRYHCRLMISDEHLLVRDLGTINGTFLNGKQLKGTRRAEDGDKIEVGPLLFQVCIEKAAPADADPDTDATLEPVEEETLGFDVGPSEDEDADIDPGTTAEFHLEEMKSEAKSEPESESEPEPAAAESKKPPPPKKKPQKPQMEDTSDAARRAMEKYFRRSV